MAKLVETREKVAAIYFDLSLYPCIKGCAHPWVKTAVTEYVKRREMNVKLVTGVNSNNNKKHAKDGKE